MWQLEITQAVNIDGRARVALLGGDNGTFAERVHVVYYCDSRRHAVEYRDLSVIDHGEYSSVTVEASMLRDWQPGEHLDLERVGTDGLVPVLHATRGHCWLHTRPGHFRLEFAPRLCWKSLPVANDADSLWQAYQLFLALSM